MMTSRGRKLVGMLPLLGALAGLIGCGADGEVVDTSGAPANEAAAEAPLVKGPAKDGEAEKAEGKGPRHGKGRHGGMMMHGPEKLLWAALHEVNLSDAQKATIKGAMDGLRDEGMKGPRDPGAFKALAESVRAGVVDKGALEAKLAGKGPDHEAHRAKVVSALNTLHATLTKEQRRELVDALAAKMDERGEKGERFGKGEKGERFGKGERGEKGFGMKGGPMGHMLRDLNLRDDQRAQIEKGLEAMKPSEGDWEAKKEAMKKDFEAKRGEMRAKLESFASDSFDANAFLPTPPKDAPRGHIEGMVRWLSVVVPVLDEAQRNTLADKLEEGPGAGMHERGGKRGAKRAGQRGGTRL